MAEALSGVSEQVIERIKEIKLEVAALQRQGFYESFRENFTPTDSIEVPEETMSEWVDALTVKTFNEELTSVFPYIYRLVKEKQERGLNYDDIVAEAATCEVCEESPCACDDKQVEGTNHLADFEQHLEDLTTFDYDVSESDKGDMDNDGQDEPDDQEYLQNKDQAIKKASGNLGEEILEFITSMYDPTTRTFPRGEEGVKIACEKKFGEQAGQFAQFAVERLSVKSQSAVQEQPTFGTAMSEEGTRSQYYYEKLADEVFALNPNLDTSGRADDLLNAAFPLMVRDLGSKKRANNLLNYDEDFPSDFVSAYGELKKGAAVNQHSTEGSDELFRIRQLSGM
jgi:hypothetical protein